MTNPVLPSYKNPPVNEVVSGVHFTPDDKLRITHFGLLWEKFRDDYPTIQHAVPIASGKETMLIDQAIGLPLPRVWFINKTDDQVIQFQIDRFYFNWRRKKGEYPRYAHVIKQFENVRNIIESFFSEYGLGKLEPIECELTYINHIPIGQGWKEINDIPNIFSDFVWKENNNRFLPNPQKINWVSEFDLPEQKGHLIVSLKQAIRADDKVPLLVLELKTQGISESLDEASIREWFDLAHKWIVQGFTDLTSPEIQKIWEREDNA